MCKNSSPPRDGSPSTRKDSLTGKERNEASTKCDEAKNILEPPSFMAKYSCLSFFVAVFSIWAKYTFIGETATPTVHTPLHGYQVPLFFTAGYLVSLYLVKLAVKKYCLGRVDMKELLLPSMIFYNVAQVFVNCWMVYRFINAILFEGHPFIGDMVSTKCVYVVWVHYTNKYLEFLDTYFMLLRGKNDQVCTHILELLFPR
jgi:elongation of very long chain fatty acids protein 4